MLEYLYSTMPKLRILSVFTNARVKNISTRIRINFEPQYSLTSKSIRNIRHSLHIILTNTRIESIFS
jgi:hypothetical protein